MEVATVFLVVLLGLASSLIVRIIQWIKRIHQIGKYMPVEPVLFPPGSKYRLLLPKRCQVYHMDWQIQYGRKIYQQKGSDVFALVSIFERDTIFLSIPEGYVELKVTGTERFQTDVRPLKKVSQPTFILI